MTALATAALDLDALLDRIEGHRAELHAVRTQVERERAARPCMTCASTGPTVRYLRGQLCVGCAPPQPRGYCLARCYCPGDSCHRPA